MAELGSGSGTGYPAALDANNLLEVNSPALDKTLIRADVPNDVNAAVVAVETELGTDPAGSLTDVKTFLQTEHNVDGTHNIGIWKRVYQNTLVGATQSVTISGLDGDTDILYWAIIRVVVGTFITIYLRPNNDSGSNYGYQSLYGRDTNTFALRQTTSSGLVIGDGVGNDVLFKGLLYAKSGYERTLNGESMTGVTGTTINTTYKIDSVWNNTASNITSLVVAASVANGLEGGTFIELWKRT